MKEFDYVIVGGGSAGCVLANRLSQDPNIRVCLIEAGGSSHGWLVKVPALLLLMVRSRLNNWSYKTTPQTALNNRQGYVPRGKAIGGSSVINTMIYTRGVARDYDLWEHNGCNGWGYDSVLRYFKKSQHREAGRNSFHGQGGELNIAPAVDPSPINKCFFEAARNLGFPYNNDFNGPIQEGVGMYELTQKNGERVSAARAFLDAARYRKNLTIVINTRVDKIVIENIKGRKVATAVQVTRARGEQETIAATKEVILSAGALGSPQLLLLSGVGAEKKLRPHSIKKMHELPGVGENLQDNPNFTINFRSRSLDTVGFSLRGIVRMIGSSFKYYFLRRGILTTNYAECGGFLYVDYAELSPDIQLHFMRGLIDDHGRKLHWGHGFGCRVSVLRPESRGNVSLNSAEVVDPPKIDSAVLSDPRDMTKLLAGTKLAQKFLLNKAFDAVRGKSLYASSSSDDAELREDIESRADTAYHPVGTCKMGVDPMAVVDPQLRVYGVDRLRVVDASVMPTLISGGTNAATIMIAEKAADMILSQF